MLLTMTKDNNNRDRSQVGVFWCHIQKYVVSIQELTLNPFFCNFLHFSGISGPFWVSGLFHNHNFLEKHHFIQI